MMNALATVSRNPQIEESDSARQEVEREKAAGNFVRAADLAAQAGFDPRETRALQRAAVRRFIEDFLNFEGAEKLISEYKLAPREVRSITEEALSNPQVAGRKAFCFHKGKPAHMPVAELISRFAARFDKD